MAGTVKGYNLTMEYVLYDMSYTNLIMYGAVIPSHKREKGEKDRDEQDVVNVDDPRNRERVKEIFNQFE